MHKGMHSHHVLVPVCVTMMSDDHLLLWWPAGKIGLYSINCPEFMLVIQAANRSGTVLGKSNPPPQLTCFLESKCTPVVVTCLKR